jgi:Putative quorum-sensing-regulated virulence factor
MASAPSETPQTHGYRLAFGKYNGRLITRVPLQYLSWMINQNTQGQEHARAEMIRRGTTLPTLQISGHALDRASLQCLGVYLQSRRDNEGIHAWLMRMALEARENGTLVEDSEGDPQDTQYIHAGMKFAFCEGEEFPALKTVMLKKERA